MKTKIEWCDYTINPVKGLCPMACSYCYARRMYKRFHWNPDIEWDEKCLIDLKHIKQPSRIFVGSTMELFGEWTGLAMGIILDIVKDYPQHTFIFLTKQPENLIKWSPFPENCWVGVSVTNTEQFIKAHKALIPPLKATVKFISFEPLLKHITYPIITEATPYGYPIEIPLSECCNWLIIGQQTPVSAKTSPKIEWLKEIVEAADKTSIPVFLKNNLKSMIPFPPIYPDILLNDDGNLRQEFPEFKRVKSE